MIDKYETNFALQQIRDYCGKFVYPLHRLDKPTSGCLLFAFDKKVAIDISHQFTARTVKKTYISVVRGWVKKPLKIQHPVKIFKDKKRFTKKEALTFCNPLSYIELDIPNRKYPKSRYTLIQMEPLTGRKHQLRQHMHHISHHIIGDVNYGDGIHNKIFRENFGISRLLLHCSEMSIHHPILKKDIVIQSQLKGRFKSFVENNFR